MVKKFRSKRFLDLTACLLGLLAAVIVLLGGEFFFRLNASHHWVQHKYPFAYRTGTVDLSGIDLSYISNLEPYPNVSDLSEPDDYGHALDTSGCPNRSVPSPPYWLGLPNCAIKATLRKVHSKRIEYEQIYHFDDHALRVIPDAASGQSRFLVFLGCSFTMGEGVSDEDTFANRITRAVGPTNAFNLGVAGYSPALTLQLLEQGKSDLRLSGIRGDNGTAIYTYIDDHFPRVFQTVGFIRTRPLEKSWPNYQLTGDSVENSGTIRKTRRIRNYAYRLLAQSEMLNFFNFDWPPYEDQQMKIFAKIIAKTRDILARDYNVKRFIFAVYPGNQVFISRLRPYLDQENIEVFDYSLLDLRSMFHGRERIFGNGHPSAEAYHLYADLVSRDLQRTVR